MAGKCNAHGPCLTAGPCPLSPSHGERRPAVQSFAFSLILGSDVLTVGNLSHALQQAALLLCRQDHCPCLGPWVSSLSSNSVCGSGFGWCEGRSHDFLPTCRCTGVCTQVPRTGLECPMLLWGGARHCWDGHAWFARQALTRVLTGLGPLAVGVPAHGTQLMRPAQGALSKRTVGRVDAEWPW